MTEITEDDDWIELTGRNRNELNELVGYDAMRGLNLLRINLNNWARNKNKVLSRDQKRFLIKAAYKKMANKKLTHSESQMKVEIHNTIGAAFQDIQMMVHADFIGANENYSLQGRGVKPKQIFPPEMWRKEIQVDMVKDLIRCLAAMYGDEYAIPMARAIRDGLADREGQKNIEVDVPIIRRATEG